MPGCPSQDKPLTLEPAAPCTRELLTLEPLCQRLSLLGGSGMDTVCACPAETPVAAASSAWAELELISSSSSPAQPGATSRSGLLIPDTGTLGAREGAEGAGASLLRATAEGARAAQPGAGTVQGDLIHGCEDLQRMPRDRPEAMSSQIKGNIREHCFNLWSSCNQTLQSHLHTELGTWLWWPCLEQGEGLHKKTSQVPSSLNQPR